MKSPKSHNDRVCVRHAKLKKGDLVGAYSHSMRLQNTPNADPTKIKYNLIACRETDWQLVPFNPNDPRLINVFKKDYIKRKAEARIHDLGIKSIRSDATIVEQMILAVSPEEIRDGSDNNPLNPTKVNAFQRAALRSQRAQHGDNLIALIIHNDEINTHSDSYVVPAIQKLLYKRGRPKNVANADVSGHLAWTLSARDLFSPAECSHDQDRFAAACRAEGLDVYRGIKGSRTPHVDMKAHMSMVHAQIPEIKPIVLLNPKEGLEGAWESKEQYFHLAQTDIAEQVVQANNSLALYYAKAYERDREVVQRKGYQRTAAQKAEQLARIEGELAKVKTELSTSSEQIRRLAERVRDIPLPEVMKALGLRQEEPDVCTSQVGNIRLHEKGFINLDGGGKGRNAVDLIRHVLACDFETSVRWLMRHFPESTTSAIQIHSRDRAEQVVEIAAAKGPLSNHETIELVAAPDSTKWPEVKRKLVQKYNLPGEKLDEWHNQKLIAATKLGNLACSLTSPEAVPGDSPCGVAILSPDAPSIPIQLVGDTTGAFVIPSSVENQTTASVLVSSPMEALAYATLHVGAGEVISPASQLSFTHVLTILARARKHLILAFAPAPSQPDQDNHSAREVMRIALSEFRDVAGSIVDLLVTSVKPKLGSWLRDLVKFKSATKEPVQQHDSQAKHQAHERQ